ncbi:MAG: aminoacetone oxidase family FAD-binding enzyme [Arcobacteraceae bacterium]|jgi:predicted Rossmann fold flavoprotein|nr:aminoacetone oxidase family FAD-binding enzyme [Arcobacteraceae bacterium]
MYDITIIGAGASGLMAASILQKQKNLKICIIDKNPKIGSKIKVSGGGKCNITNKYLSSNFYLGDTTFIDNTFKKFDNNALLKFLKLYNLIPNLNEKIVKGTYFCHSSDEVISLFSKLTSGCDFLLDNEVLDVNYLDSEYLIKTHKRTIKSKKLIIATGGISYPSLGATDIGYKIAQKFGHTLTTPNPALVGFTVQKEQFWFKELSGLSMDVRVKVEDKILEGSLLFTHKGCSGPVILSTSLYWKKGQISIDFAPTKESYLPKRFKQAIKDLDIDIHNYQFAPAGNFGFTKAEVTKGGVAIEEIDENFESKLQKDLYFIGEVLDVTGELGGYNFQWAFSSGYVCSQNLLIGRY